MNDRVRIQELEERICYLQDELARAHVFSDKAREKAKTAGRIIAELKAQLPPEPAGIYVASRTRHAAMWRTLREEGWPIISTWIYEAGVGETTSWTDLWRRCVSEAYRARSLIVYAEEGDHPLKGALVEVGAALARQRPVYVVGHEYINASWFHHPQVKLCETLEEALAATSLRALVETVGG